MQAVSLAIVSESPTLRAATTIGASEELPWQGSFGSSFTKHQRHELPLTRLGRPLHHSVLILLFGQRGVAAKDGLGGPATQLGGQCPSCGNKMSTPSSCEEVALHASDCSCDGSPHLLTRPPPALQAAKAKIARPAAHVLAAVRVAATALHLTHLEGCAQNSAVEVVKRFHFPEVQPHLRVETLAGHVVGDARCVHANHGHLACQSQRPTKKKERTRSSKGNNSRLCIQITFLSSYPKAPSVRVPVLSLQMTEAEPKVSTAASFRTSTSWLT